MALLPEGFRLDFIGVIFRVGGVGSSGGNAGSIG